MRIALAADEPYEVHATLQAELQRRGHELVPFGAIADGCEHDWAAIGEQAGAAVADGRCEMGVLLCWSGTGICMAANKQAGVRAALCGDAVTARAARHWNDANVLCLSNRTLSPDLARELLDAWFEAAPLPEAHEGIAHLADSDRRHRR